MAHILIVDDDRELVEALSDVLEAEGHTVCRASDGKEGLTQLVAEHPDVVLCDVEMPVLDGPGMAKRILVHDAGAEKIPLVLLSGVRDIGRLARTLGTPYFLGKPYEVDRLLALLERVLVERTPPNPPSAATERGP